MGTERSERREAGQGGAYPGLLSALNSSGVCTEFDLTSAGGLFELFSSSEVHKVSACSDPDDHVFLDCGPSGPCTPRGGQCCRIKESHYGDIVAGVKVAPTAQFLPNCAQMG